jgi:Flp pilus assembly protein TadG
VSGGADNSPSASWENERPRVTPLSLEQSAQRAESLNSIGWIRQPRYNEVVRRLFRASARHPERGATAVEFAWVLPILMAVTLGTIDLGRMVVFKQMCAYAAMAGARTAMGRYESDGSTLLTSGDVQQAAIKTAPMLKLTTTNVLVTVSGSTTSFTSRTRGDTVTVTVQYTFTPLVPKISKIASPPQWKISSAMVIP